MHRDCTDQKIRETQSVVRKMKESLMKKEDIAHTNTAHKLQAIERKKRESLKRKSKKDAVELIKRAKATMNEKTTGLLVSKCVEEIDCSIPPPPKKL